MFKRVALWKKLAFIGLVAVVALTGLYGAVLWSNSMVHENLAMANVRGEQLDTVAGMRKAQLELTLAAMDSIIDKAAGDVD